MSGTGLNIRKELERRVVADLKQTTGMTYYDFDFDGVDVKVVSTEYSNLESTCKPVSLDSDTAQNCTERDQKYTNTFQKAWTESFRLTLGVRVGWKKEVSGSVNLPVGSIGGKTSLEIDLSAQTEWHWSEQTTITKQAEATIPGCGNKIDAILQIDDCKTSGDVTVKVLAHGWATASIDVDWAFDPEVKVLVYEEFTVTGRFEAREGRNTKLVLNQYPIDCPEGTVCQLRRGTPTPGGGGGGQDRPDTPTPGGGGQDRPGTPTPGGGGQDRPDTPTPGGGGQDRPDTPTPGGGGQDRPDTPTPGGGGPDEPDTPGGDEGGTDKEPVESLPAGRYVVREGDSLWLIASRRLGSATADEIEAMWQRIYAANREVIGNDPNLIHPGQVLRLP